MKRINLLAKLVVATFIIMSILYSCKASCDCCKKHGCITITVVPYPATGDTIAVKSFCSETNVYSKNIQDSIQDFCEDFQKNREVSIYRHSNVITQDCVFDLTEKEADAYLPDYDCVCYK